MENENYRYVIINGMHRSGTMFLSRLINAFPDTFIIKDGLRFPWFYYRVETGDRFSYPRHCYRLNKIKYDLSKRPSDLEFLKNILKAEIRQLSLPDSTRQSMNGRIDRFREGIIYHDMFEQIFDDLRQSLKANAVGAKNTHMFQFKNKMLRTYPGLKWIEIIRDLRGWYCSTKVSHPLNLISSAKLWNKAVGYTKKVDPDVSSRYCLLTFEDLIENHKSVLQRLADFLECNLTVSDDWLKNLTLTGNDGTNWFPNPSYTKNGEKILGDQNKYRSTDYTLFDPVPVKRWQTRLTTVEKSALKCLSGNNLKYFKGLHG